MSFDESLSSFPIDSNFFQRSFTSASQFMNGKDPAESKNHRQQLQRGDDEIHKDDWRQTAAFQTVRLSPFWR